MDTKHTAPTAIVGRDHLLMPVAVIKLCSSHYRHTNGGNTLKAAASRHAPGPLVTSKTEVMFADMIAIKSGCI